MSPMGETCFFIGRGYVISVRHGPSLSYADVRARCENAPDRLKKGEDFVLYALMDFIVDNYFPIFDHIEELVEELEERVFAGREERDALEKSPNCGATSWRCAMRWRHSGHNASA